MVKTIGSNSMAFGALKRVADEDQPVAIEIIASQSQSQSEVVSPMRGGGGGGGGGGGSPEEPAGYARVASADRDSAYFDADAEAGSSSSSSSDYHRQERAFSALPSSEDEPSSSFRHPHFGPTLQAPKSQLRYTNGSEFYEASGTGTGVGLGSGGGLAPHSGGVCSLVGYLLTRRQILLSCFLYGLVGFYGVFMVEIFPLWVVTDIVDGGFAYESHDIGWAMTVSGPISIAGQLIFYPSLVEKHGLIKTYSWACQLFFVTSLLMPCASFLSGYPVVARAYLTLGLAVMSTVQMWIFISIFTFINNSCYSHQRSTVNGIGQTFAALGRLSAPFIGSNLFAWSETNGLAWPLNFSLCWYVISGLALWSSSLVHNFPKSIQRRKREPKRARYASPNGGGGLNEEEEEEDEDT
jgi:hypothetical protein